MEPLCAPWLSQPVIPPAAPHETSLRLATHPSGREAKRCRSERCYALRVGRRSAEQQQQKQQQKQQQQQQQRGLTALAAAGSAFVVPLLHRRRRRCRASGLAPLVRLAAQARGQEEPRLLREEFCLWHEQGTLEGVVVRLEGRQDEGLPVVLVNAGCYGTLASTLEGAEGPRYAAQGYAYVIVRATDGMEDVADSVFARWRADAAAVLDWLGQQPWCNGRVGCHGYSLLGNTAYAALGASQEPGPPGRARVCALMPAVSFSRIQPTVFVQGQGLAAELALRFLLPVARRGRASAGQALWLELRVGLDLSSCVDYLGFFALPDWPGLKAALSQRPVAPADESLWGRPNRLWRAGQTLGYTTSRLSVDDFWQEGRDAQCNFDLEAVESSFEMPAIHVVAGWHDMFLLQSLEDFAAAGRDYQGSAAKVRLQVIGAEPGQDWLECDFWPPPPPERSLQFYLSSGDSCQPPATTTGSLELAPRPEQSSAETSSLQYVYDPADPTPYSGGGWLNLQKDGPKDQRSLESQRKEDMLVLTSAPLQESLEVLGEVEVTLFVSCSAAECDLVARLCVVRSGSLEEGDGSTGPLGLLVQLPQTLNRLLDRRELGPGQSLNVCEGLARVNFSQPDADNSNNNNHNTNNNQNKNNEDNKDNNNADNSNNNNSNTTNNNNTNNNNNNDADGPPGFRRV
ncbi:unnamed protein product, partial [Polarella glacialis]